jgi:catechol 2,3-dioxygenase-like lactoylglutathione lyase family enzyme
MSGLPLLGVFHEFSVACADVRDAVEFYERLGFTQGTTTDAYPHPYGMLSDGHLYIGLHRRPPPTPVLSFVRRAVAQSVPAFAAAGIELTVCRTGEEVFNEIGFEDPCGQAVAVLEARTYSPVERGTPDPSACGDFVQVSLPVTDVAAAQSFWESLGFVATGEEDTPYPHLPLTSDHLDIALHHPRLCAQPMLVFQAADMRARISHLRALGVTIAAAPRGVAAGAARVESPDGTVLLLVPQIA